MSAECETLAVSMLTAEDAVSQFGTRTAEWLESAAHDAYSRAEVRAAVRASWRSYP